MDETEQNVKEGRTEKNIFYAATQKNISLLSLQSPQDNHFFGNCFESPQSLEILTACQKVNGNSSLIRCALQLEATVYEFKKQENICGKM